MRVLMLSLDKTLLGEQIAGKFGIQGDTIARHRKYGELIEHLNIIVSSPKGFFHTKLSDNVDVYPTNCDIRVGRLLCMVRYAKNIISHEGIDLVVSQDITAPSAYLIKKIFNIPYIVTFHSDGIDSPEMKKNISHRILLPVIKYSLLRSDGLRVVSQEVKRKFKNLGYDGPIEVIPTATDHAIFAKERVDKISMLRKKYSGKRVILTSGRLTKVKNFPLLFDVLKTVKKKYDNVILLIIGTGELEDELKAEVKKKRLTKNVEFLGSMAYEETVAYYRVCDLFVLTSDSESLGKVLIHAGASGKPVVSTKTIGAKSIVRDGKTGYLADIGDAKQIADRVMELLSDEKLRTRFGESARKIVLRKYDAEISVKKFIKFWKRVATR